MISKVKSIKNVGKFEVFNGSEQLEKNTVIFGFNGAGKSTLSDIFYSLTSEGKNNSVIRRRTLNRPNETGDKVIEIILEDENGAELTFVNDSWETLPYNVHVFNNQYIEDYVFVSRQLLGNAVPIGMGPIGTKCMKLREQLIEENKKIIEQINIDISCLGSEGIKIKDFSNQKVTEKTKLNRFERMATFFLYPLADKPIVEERIRNNAKYTKELLDIETCEMKYEELRGIEIIDKALILKNVRRMPRVSSKDIARFLGETMTSADIKWAVAGYRNQKSKEVCPMCGQTISDKRAIELFHKLGKYISQNRDESIREFCSRLNLLASRLQLLKLSDKVKIFNEIVQLLYTDELLLKRDTKKLQKGLAWNEDNTIILESVIEKIYRKVENPYVEIFFSDEEVHNLSLANAVIKNMSVLGEIIAQSKERLERKIDRKLSMDDMSVVFDLSYGKCRDIAEQIKANSATYIKNQKKIAELNEQIDDCYNQIQLNIVNHYLSKLNTHIKLEVNKNRYYVQLKDFEAKEYLNRKDAIFSEGEQRAIAFAYFLSEVNSLDNQSRENIIVVDDPISSMDLNRKSIVSHQIAEMMKNPQWQVIILTHDISFVERIEGFLIRGVLCKNIELRSEKNDFQQLNISDYLTDDVQVYKELISDAEVYDDELTRVVALVSLRPFSHVKKVSELDYKEIQEKSTYFSHTLYSKKKGITYRAEDYTKDKLKEYVDCVATATGEKFDAEKIVGEYSFKGFDFSTISTLYRNIPLDSMKNARKKVLLMRPLIEACFFQFSAREKFDPENIGSMYEKTKNANKNDAHKYNICIALQEMYDSSKKYHHGAEDGSLLGIAWINPNEVEYYDQKLIDIINDIQTNCTIRELSA